ncbi:hypothetical protein D6789_04345 [Candidatus Woesearchaeota archaeon]|nr:MAG: hypothetical protein D6789_04345 [Candidatus Woesearchaeota archaeon]
MSYLVNNELTVPVEDLPRIMHALKDTQAIHTERGAKTFGFSRPVLPGVLLSAYARQAVSALRNGQFCEQRTLFAQPALAGDTVHFVVDGQDDQFAVTGILEGKKAFRSRIRYGTVAPEPVAATPLYEPHRIAHPGERLRAIGQFYRGIGQECIDDVELSSLVLAHSVPPLLALKEQLFADTDYVIAEHRIQALRPLSDPARGETSVFTDAIAVTSHDIDSRGRVTAGLHGFSDYFPEPTFAVTYKLIPLHRPVTPLSDQSK